jgi:glycosyltransferase involved in cell wall biosynthesis
LLNNGATWDCDDNRVRIITSENLNAGVGAYKGEAVQYCRGDVFLELDHDDYLDPTSLEEVVRAFEENPEVGFIYSNTIQVREDGSPDNPNYDGAYGWKYHMHGEHFVYESFGAHPHNVNLIWYAPNHLRAFRRTAYEAIGGYDRSLKVLDDQNLMSRLYRETNFLHIDKPLYFQRTHDKNTQKDPETNAFIQVETVNQYMDNIESSMLVWAERNDLLALDLGAAHNKTPGYLAVDLDDAPGVDYVGDFMNLPFKSNSVGVIRAYDFMEHIADRQGLMERFYDLLSDGGMLISMTPSTDGRGAFQDPTHVGYWNENSFWYYTETETAKYIGSPVRFQVACLRTIFPSDWHREHNISYVQAILIAIKDNQRKYGGILSI